MEWPYWRWDHVIVFVQVTETVPGYLQVKCMVLKNNATLLWDVYLLFSLQMQMHDKSMIFMRSEVGQPICVKTETTTTSATGLLKSAKGQPNLWCHGVILVLLCLQGKISKWGLKETVPSAGTQAPLAQVRQEFLRTHRRNPLLLLLLQLFRCPPLRSPFQEQRGPRVPQRTHLGYLFRISG